MHRDSANGMSGGRALVVYESFFGNTEHIAEAVAAGLRLEDWSAIVLDVTAVDDNVLEGIDLLIVGAPTHAFALSRPSTRREAVGRGGRACYARVAMREWLEQLAPSAQVLAAAFDTRASKVRHLPASASRSAAHMLRAKGYRLITRSHGFVVCDIDGPLESRQTETAIAWGRVVACDAQSARAAHHIA